MIRVRRPRGPVLAAAALALTLSLGSAQAQGLRSNSDEPIDITADNLELVDADRVQIWSGAVEAVQGRNRLRSTVLRVYHAARPGGGGERGQWGDPQRMEADGPVHFVTPDAVARGDSAVYELVPDQITLTGDVVLTRGESVVKGDRLTIDVKTGRSVLASNQVGRGKARVRGVFFSEDRGRSGGR